jgi:hypothetical protein
MAPGLDITHLWAITTLALEILAYFQLGYLLKQVGSCNLTHMYMYVAGFEYISGLGKE